MLVDVTAPLHALLPGTVGALPDDTSVEFESTVPVGARVFPHCSVSGPGRDRVVEIIEDCDVVDAVDLVHDADTDNVYRVAWDEELPSLLVSLRAATVSILSAEASEDSVTLELRFPDQAACADFYAAYSDPDHPITISRIDTGASRSRQSTASITDDQREALLTALEAGYFEIPRRATLVDLSAELSISDSAVSQRLRRGMANVLENSIAAGEDLDEQLTGDTS